MAIDRRVIKVGQLAERPGGGSVGQLMGVARKRTRVARLSYRAARKDVKLLITVVYSRETV